MSRNNAPGPRNTKLSVRNGGSGSPPRSQGPWQEEEDIDLSKPGPEAEFRRVPEDVRTVGGVILLGILVSFFVFVAGFGLVAYVAYVAFFEAGEASKLDFLEKILWGVFVTLGGLASTLAVYLFGRRRRQRRDRDR